MDKARGKIPGDENQRVESLILQCNAHMHVQSLILVLLPLSMAFGTL